MAWAGWRSSDSLEAMFLGRSRGASDAMILGGAHLTTGTFVLIANGVRS